MRVRSFHHVGFVLALLAAGQLVLRADEAPKSPPTPIIFSAPKSDTVSSNLNQMGAKSSSLLDLESGLTKPFEVFDSARTSEGVRPNQFSPSAPPPGISNRKLKDILEKRAEESYLLSEDNDANPSHEDLMRSERDSLDSTSRRSQTPLDRYYDRIDRLRAGATNQPSRDLDLLGEKEDANEKDSSKSRRSGRPFDNELSVNARALNAVSNANNTSERGFLFSERLKPRSFGSTFELGPVTTQPGTRTKETRLDEFKRLLEGPSYGARSEFNVTPPSSSPTYPSLGSTPPAPSSSLSLETRPASGSYAPGLANTIGTPTGVPEMAVRAPSLTTPPVQQPAPKPPQPEFRIPRARF